MLSTGSALSVPVSRLADSFVPSSLRQVLVFRAVSQDSTQRTAPEALFALNRAWVAESTHC